MNAGVIARRRVPGGASGLEEPMRWAGPPPPRAHNLAALTNTRHSLRTDISDELTDRGGRRAAAECERRRTSPCTGGASGLEEPMRWAGPPPPRAHNLAALTNTRHSLRTDISDGLTDRGGRRAADECGRHRTSPCTGGASGLEEPRRWAAPPPPSIRYQGPLRTRATLSKPTLSIGRTMAGIAMLLRSRVSSHVAVCLRVDAQPCKSDP
jgi:hypothetical protein